jgi:hypothetical protein
MVNRQTRKGRPQRRFTPEEDRLIRESFLAYVPIESIAAELNRDWGTVRQRIMRLGLHRSHLVSRWLRQASGELASAFLAGKLDEAAFLERCRAERDELGVANEMAAAQERTWQRMRIDSECRHLLEERGLDRNQKIRAMREAGATLEQIAVLFGITRERVRQVCDPKFYERVVMPRQVSRYTGEQQRLLLNKLVRYWRAMPSELRDQFRREIGV